MDATLLALPTRPSLERFHTDVLLIVAIPAPDRNNRHKQQLFLFFFFLSPASGSVQVGRGGHCHENRDDAEL